MRRSGRLFAPAIVITSNQTRGRGRGANEWFSGDGSLTMTLALPVAEHLKPHQVPLIAGLAVRNALCELSGSEEIQLKWPNDLLIGDRKLGGLLCERVEKADLIGIGINVSNRPTAFSPKIRDRCATLLEIACGSIDMNVMIAALATHVHRRLSKRNEYHFNTVLREYHRHHALVDRRIHVETPSLSELSNRLAKQYERLSGVCLGLDGMGRLLLREDRDASHVHRIVAGHVVLR